MKMTDAMKLDTLARGALLERFDHAMLEAMANVLDPNTVAQGKRVVQITLTIKPNEERSMCALSAEVRTKLQPRAAVATTVTVGEDGNGEVHFREFNPGQNPGQHQLPVPGEATKTTEEQAKGTLDNGAKVVPISAGGSK